MYCFQITLVWIEVHKVNEAFDQDIRVGGFYEKTKKCNITSEPELTMQWSRKNKTEINKFYPWFRASQFIILMRQQNLELVSKNGYGSQLKRKHLFELSILISGFFTPPNVIVWKIITAKKNGDKSCQSNFDKRSSDFGSFLVI